MATPASKRKHLRLYTEQPPKPAPTPMESVAVLPQLLQSFQTATGWTLQYASGKPGSSRPATKAARPASNSPSLVLDAPSPLAKDDTRAAVDHDAAQRLAGSIADLLGELLKTQNALRRREAELAAGVPMVPHGDEEKHLAERLQATLLAGAEAVGCQAAALYLLDDATTALKLRSACGLPFDRLTAPARPLQGAVADLEAMLGHAVVLNDDLMAVWHAPEEYPAAVCVPVSTPTTLLGTLWVFSEEKRDFNDHETNIIEVVAGRVASDLEREMLLRTAIDGATLQKQLAAVERLQRNELPLVSPVLDGLDLAGWTGPADGVGGTFHDWFCLADGMLAIAVGRAAEQGIAGALTSGSLKTALRSHAQYHRDADRVLRQINTTLWTSSAGDRHAELFLGFLETATSRFHFSSAGKPSAILLQADGWQSLGRNSIRLGKSPEADFRQFQCELAPGEALVIVADAVPDSSGGQTDAPSEAEIAQLLQGKLDLSAAELVAMAKAAFDRRGCDDRSILVIKSKRA